MPDPKPASANHIPPHLIEALRLIHQGQLSKVSLHDERALRALGLVGADRCALTETAMEVLRSWPTMAEQCAAFVPDAVSFHKDLLSAMRPPPPEFPAAEPVKPNPQGVNVVTPQQRKASQEAMFTWDGMVGCTELYGVDPLSGATFYRARSRGRTALGLTRASAIGELDQKIQSGKCPRYEVVAPALFCDGSHGTVYRAGNTYLAHRVDGHDPHLARLSCSAWSIELAVASMNRELRKRGHADPALDASPAVDTKMGSAEQTPRVSPQEAEMRQVLGAKDGESTLETVKRLVSEREEAKRLLGMMPADMRFEWPLRFEPYEDAVRLKLGAQVGETTMAAATRVMEQREEAKKVLGAEPMDSLLGAAYKTADARSRLARVAKADV